MTEHPFIEFLRWCLNTSDKMPSCIEFINWEDLLAFAKKQTIVGVYWQGINRLDSSTQLLSEDNVMEWMEAYCKITRRNAQVDAAIIKLNRLLSSNHIKFVVFKGQTLARFYPVPESRTSGDIDFYVYKKDWNKAIALIKNIAHITDHHSFQHLEFEVDNVIFEMHYHTAVFTRKTNQKYWDDLIEDIPEGLLDNVNINKVLIPTLPPTIYAIYLFIHVYHHILKEGVGLRQFIDWKMFLEAKHSEINSQELAGKLNTLGLTKAFKAFGTILVAVLGMNANLFPLPINNSDRKYTGRILEIILRYGNFGKYNRKVKVSGWRHSIETGLRSATNISRLFWLSPYENALWLPLLIRQSLTKNL